MTVTMENMEGGSGYDTDDKSDITHLHFLTVSTIYVVVDIIHMDVIVVTVLTVVISTITMLKHLFYI